MPGATPVKVALDWYVLPSILYSTPDCVVKTIVPVVTAHVGCTVTLPTGAVKTHGGATGTGVLVAELLDVSGSGALLEIDAVLA